MSQGPAGLNILSNTVDIGGASVSAFGTLETAELTPLVQLDFIYGINTQTGVTSVANTGVVDTLVGRLRIQTGTNAAGAGTFTSRKTAKYRPGQGVMARFTAAWATSAASSTQIVGAGTSADGYFFGFNGVTFGILHKNAGVSNWIAQTAWNGDKCDGSGVSGFNWNKTNGNVMMIKYPFLGYGNIKFYVQNSTTSGWILVHTIQYANSSPSIQLANPNLSFYANVTNDGSTTNLTMYVGSVGMFLSGMRSFAANPRWATDNNKASITAETSVFGLRNCATYNGVTNRGLIRLHAFSFGTTAASGIAVARLRIGATLGGVPAYTPINGGTADNGVTITSGNSIASVDTAATTSTAGTLLFNLTGGNPTQQMIDLTPFDLFIAPGEVLTCAVFSGNATTGSIALNWSEDI